MDCCRVSVDVGVQHDDGRTAGLRKNGGRRIDAQGFAFRFGSNRKSSHGHVATSRCGRGAGIGNDTAGIDILLKFDAFSVCRVLGRMPVLAIGTKWAKLAGDGSDSDVLFVWYACLRFDANGQQAFAVAGNGDHFFSWSGRLSFGRQTIQLIVNQLLATHAVKQSFSRRENCCANQKCGNE